MVANGTDWCFTCFKAKTRAPLRNHKRWKGKAQNKRETFGLICKSVMYKNLGFYVLGFFNSTKKQQFKKVWFFLTFFAFLDIIRYVF